MADRINSNVMQANYGPSSNNQAVVHRALSINVAGILNSQKHPETMVSEIKKQIEAEYKGMKGNVGKTATIKSLCQSLKLSSDQQLGVLEAFGNNRQGFTSSWHGISSHERLARFAYENHQASKQESTAVPNKGVRLDSTIIRHDQGLLDTTTDFRSRSPIAEMKEGDNPLSTSPGTRVSIMERIVRTESPPSKLASGKFLDPAMLRRSDFKRV